MISPKEKALELIEKFKINDYDWIAQGNLHCVLQHALVTVDEILNSSPSLPILGDGGYLYEDIELSKNYWQEVKQEIKNVKL